MIPEHVKAAVRQKVTELIDRLLTEPNAGCACCTINGPEGFMIEIFIADKTAATWIHEIIDARMTSEGPQKSPIPRPN